MSNVRGKISIDVQFADSTTSAGVQSLKTITLQDTTEYTSGKVAIVTGTVGTATQGVDTSRYLNASGNPVTFSTISRIALQSPTQVRLSSGFSLLAVSKNNQLSITSNVLNNDSPGTLVLNSFSGTASYTLVLYGE